MSKFWTIIRTVIKNYVDTHSTCTQESVHERSIHVCMKCIRNRTESRVTGESVAIRVFKN